MSKNFNLFSSRLSVGTKRNKRSLQLKKDLTFIEEKISTQRHFTR